MLRMSNVCCIIFFAAISLALTIGEPSYADASERDTVARLSYLAAGIRHFRTTLPDAAVHINVEDGLALDPRSAGQPQFGDNAPNESKVAVSWISQDDNLSFDVQYLGNMDADHGDNVWYCIQKRLVSNNGNVIALNEFRKIIPQNNGTVKKLLGWSGNIDVNGAFTDGLWDEEYQLDPRYFAYYVDDKPLDVALESSSTPTTVLGSHQLFSSNCEVVQTKVPLPDGSVFEKTCWIDTDHDFIIRKAVLINFPVGGSKEKPTTFSICTIPTLIHVRSGWLPAVFFRRIYLPGRTRQGQFKIFTEVQRATVEQLNDESPELKSPFVIVWPEGTYVSDMPLNKRYIASSDGTLKDAN